MVKKGGLLIMPKRGENIRKRKDGRWEARLIIFRNENGEATYKSVYAKTYTEVKKIKTTFNIQENKYNRNKTAIKNISHLCDEWLKKTKIKIKDSTHGTYHRVIHNHVIPYFNNIELRNINNKIVQDFIAYKHDSGLSAKTIHDMVIILLQIIKYAEKEKYIIDFDYDIDLPKLQIKEAQILTSAEEEKLNDYLKNNLTLINFGVILTKETGIRIGELCALKWSDINLNSKTLSITKTIQRIKNFDVNATSKTKIVITAPKSQKSVREIPLPDTIIAIVKKLYNHQNPDTYILTGTTKYIEPRLFQKKFKQLLEKLGIGTVTVHSLRHLFATKAVENRFDSKSLSEILGHAKVTFTHERYVHSSSDLKRSHMNRMASCF